MKIKKSIIGIFVFFSIFLINFPLLAQEKGQYPVRLFLFHSDACPHCKEELKFLEKLKLKYPNLEVRDFEVSSDYKNLNLFKQVTKKYNISGNVPANIIGDEAIIGFDGEQGTGKELEERVNECTQKACPSWLDGVLGLPPLSENKEAVIAEDENDNGENDEGVKVNILGKQITFDNQSSKIFLGIILGLVDGINPCMFSVLLFLLTYLMSVGSKKKAVKAGIAFAITTFFVYLSLMLGFLTIVDVLRLSGPVKVVIIFFALFAGLIMIKDYFYYGRWVSLEIPATFKPYLENLVKKGTVLSAIILAFLSSLVELPCTSGIPLVYISVISDAASSKFFYLVIYNLFFILPLVFIILSVVFVWAKIEKVEQWRVASRKYMRLAGGILLVALALALWKDII